jgi:L-ribulokinase
MSSTTDEGTSGARYVVGVDYGTLSGRAVVIRTSDGAQLGTEVHPYGHAVLDRALPDGTPLPPEWALQVPADYLEVLRRAVPGAIRDAGIDPADVVGIGIDFTACTILPVLADGTPLVELDEFRGRPHAYVKLWKHHAAQPQADRINAVAGARGEGWLARYGGKLSSEWALAKGLQLFEEDRTLYDRMDRFVEAADWVVWQLSGRPTRTACLVGYKAVRQDGAFPAPEFLEELAPGFGDFFVTKMAGDIVQLGERVGGLSAQAAAWTGLPEGIAVASANADAHVTSAAADALDAGQMLLVMGTSTCHIMNGDRLADVPGMCGVVDGGVVPGLFGYEAGQSGVGDIFGWFVDHGVPAQVVEEAARAGTDVHGILTRRAAELRPGESGLIALDWHSGNRSVLVDHDLSGVIVGQTLTTEPHEIYRALMEATAFGTRRIVAAFESSGVPVRELVIAGGLLRNTFLMQLYADITRRPLSIIDSDQAPALGSAMHAAVAAGEYPDIRSAAAAMARVLPHVYTPDAAAADVYDVLYEEYLLLHDYFGLGENDVMRRLKRMRREILGAATTGP